MTTGPADPAPHQQRVAVLTGDRLCASCGFNLYGQTITRESHYGMLIVRCPECSTVAALQEYPALGRWAGRWAAVLAGLWFMTLIGLGAASAGIMSAISYETAQRFTQPAALRLAEAFIAWTVDDANSGQFVARVPWGAWAANQSASFHTWIDDQWLADQDLRALTAGPFSNRYDARAARVWVYVAVSGFIIGCFWSVALLHLRWRGLLLAAVAITALSGLFSSMGLQGMRMWGSTLAREAAYKEFGAPALAATVIFSILPLMLGMCLGRRLARLAARALLPPRLRGLLAFLWFADGLPAPKMRHDWRPGA